MTSHTVPAPVELESGSPGIGPQRNRNASKEATENPAFPFGYRWREVRGADGSKRYEQMALAREDFLNPQIGDVMPQGNWHDQFLNPLVALLRLRLRALGMHVFHDMIVRFGIPGVSNPAPDISVIRHEHMLDPKKIESWNAREIEKRPFFVAEALSPSTQKMDLEDKRIDYAKAGVGEYFIFNILKDPVEILAYRLIKTRRVYRKIRPDPQGRFVAKTLGLAFRVEKSKPLGVVVEDPATGEVLLTLDERVENLEEQNDDLESALRTEVEARETAEERAEKEAKRAEKEAKRAEKEAKRAEKEAKRAEKEAKRAAELAAKLRAMGIDP